MRSLINFTLRLLMLLLATGCGSKLELLPVAGLVTLDGQPVAGAAVLFAPVEEGPAVHAVTDAQGRFTLQTGNDAGAPAGKYRVAIALQELGDWKGDPTGTSGSPPPGAPMGKWLIPEKFASPATSGLAAEVTSEQTAFAFHLTP